MAQARKETFDSILKNKELLGKFPILATLDADILMKLYSDNMRRGGVQKEQIFTIGLAIGLKEKMR